MFSEKKQGGRQINIKTEERFAPPYRILFPVGEVISVNDRLAFPVDKDGQTARVTLGNVQILHAGLSIDYHLHLRGKSLLFNNNESFFHNNSSGDNYTSFCGRLQQFLI